MLSTPAAFPFFRELIALFYVESVLDRDNLRRFLLCIFYMINKLLLYSTLHDKFLTSPLLIGPVLISSISGTSSAVITIGFVSGVY